MNKGKGKNKTCSLHKSETTCGEAFCGKQDYAGKNRKRHVDKFICFSCFYQ